MDNGTTTCEITMPPSIKICLPLEQVQYDFYDFDPTSEAIIGFSWESTLQEPSDIMVIKPIGTCEFLALCLASVAE